MKYAEGHEEKRTEKRRAEGDVKSLVGAARRFERAGKWAEATAAWNAIAATAREEARRDLRRKAEARRGRLKPGATLTHERVGRPKVRCRYLGPGRVVYRGRRYPSLSAAATAAGHDLGMRSEALSGWLFWDLEERVKPRTIARALH